MFQRHQGVRAVQGTRWRQVDISGIESYVLEESMLVASNDEGGDPRYEVVVHVPEQYQSLIVPGNFPIPELRNKPLGPIVRLLDTDLEPAGWWVFFLDAFIQGDPLA